MNLPQNKRCIAIAMRGVDASDLGYGGTWGPNLEKGSPGDYEGQGLWTATERQASISVRELRAVRLLFRGHFVSLARDPDVRNVLLWEDNSAVVTALNRMVSRSPAMMSELRKLHRVLHKVGVHLQAKWLSSAVNRYADRLSRMWNVKDVTLTSSLIDELAAAYSLHPVHFRYPPTGDHPCALRKQAMTQLEESWGDARLWNPPPDLIPLVLRKIQPEGGTGLLLVPTWPVQPWWHRIESLGGQVIRQLPPASQEGPKWTRPDGRSANPGRRPSSCSSQQKRPHEATYLRWNPPCSTTRPNWRYFDIVRGRPYGEAYLGTSLRIHHISKQ